MPRTFAGLYTLDDLFAMAWSAAAGSPDLSVQNGAVIVSPTGLAGLGCNDLTCGMEVTPERLARPLKYAVTEHAERNAVYHAARFGHRLKGATMVCLWAACADCARAIVQSGIVELIRHKWFLDASGREPHWLDSIRVGDEILAAAGVAITDHDGPIRTNGVSLRFAGKLVNPWEL